MRLFYKTKKLLLIAATMFSTGMAFAQTEEYGVVWSLDFEDESTYTDGWSYQATPAYVTSNGSHVLDFSHQTANGTRSASYTFTNEFFSTATDYKFEFDWGVSAAHWNKDGYTYMTLTSNNTEGFLFKTSTRSNVASTSIIASDGSTEITTIATDGYTGKTPTNIFHFTIKGNNENGMTLTITQGETVILAETKVSETLVAITGISVSLNRAYGHMAFDNFKLSVLGEKEKINAPLLSITKVNGINRTITIEPGIGSAGTLAESTYYTTDGTAPSKENGTEYTEPIVISATTTIKAISYLPDGTASEVSTFEAEAGTIISLSNNIIDVTGLMGEGDIKNAVVSNVYTSEEVLCTPEATVTCTFNGEEITLPYTVTEDGTFVATASADGYESTTETLNINGGYVVLKHVDFTTVTDENITEVLGDTWSILETNTRWSGWDSSNGNIYSIATCSDPANLTEFLGSTCGTMIVGYGVARNHNSATKYWINNPKEGQIALYEVNETKKSTTDFAQYVVAYADNSEMSHSVYNVNAIAKVSVYTPVRELVIDDNSVECADFAPEYESYSKITYNRDFTAGYYYLMVLPFAPDETSLQNYSFYKLSSVADDAVTFAEETAPVANTPYLCCLKEVATTTNSITGGPTTVSTEVNNETVGTWTLVGSLKNETVNSTSSDNYLLHPINKTLHKVTSSLTVYPYTAYLQNSLTGIEVAPATMRLFISGPTGIKEISVDRVEGFGTGCFDLLGRPISKPMKGQIYIKDGKKIMH